MTDCTCNYDHEITEAEHEGKKVKLNDPFRLPSGSKKKFGVYVKNDKDNIVKVQLMGNCVSCTVNQMTLKNGVEMTIKKHAPQIKKVISVE